MFNSKLNSQIITVVTLFFLIIVIFNSVQAAEIQKEDFFISAAELKTEINQNQNLKIIDVRNSARHLLGHIPKSVQLWGDDLNAQQGWVPELIPEAQFFSDIAQKKGINNNSKIVVYSEQDSPWAARLWFIFRFYGHQNIKILKGGYQAWQQKDFETEMLPTKIEKGNFEVQDALNENLIVSDTIAENLENDDYLILDLRTKAEFLGEKESSGASRSGRIPGSIHLDWSEVFTEKEKLKSEDELLKIFTEIGLDIDLNKDNKNIILVSTEGVKAAHVFFILEELGYKNLKLYDEAWLGWSSRSDLPIKTD